jgi:hypothetical protein
MGRALLTSGSTLEWNYFKENTTQRSLGWREDLKLDLRLNRLMPYIQGGKSRTTQRPSLDIDERVETDQTTAGAGFTLQATANVSVSIGVQQSETVYGSGLTSGSEAIGEALDGKRRGGDLTVRYAATQLTTFVVRGAAQAERYLQSSLRDSDSTTVMAGVELRPAALISGSVMVGYTEFRPISSVVPPYKGLVATVNAAYVMREMTRFAVAVNRGIGYSIDDIEPYSVTTDGQLTINQMIATDWYATGRLGYVIMAFRQTLDADAGQTAGEGRNDRVALVGLGGGRRIGEYARVEFNVDHYQRDSPQEGRRYSGYRLGGAVLYGF